MRIFRCFLILVILGLSSTAALADTITDPALGVKGGTGSMLWPGGVTFTINSDTTGATCEGGTCDFISPVFFINAGTITSFDFSFDTNQVTGFTALEGSAFPTVTTIVPFFDARLSGGTIFPFADCGESCTPTSTQIFGDFYFEMRGVVDGSTVTVASPEPGTMILLLSGLGALGLRRLRRNKAPS